MVFANLAERRKQEGKEKAGQTDAWSHGYICLGRTGGERIQATSACPVRAAEAGVEKLSCRTAITAGADVKVSLAVTSSHCSSMAA